MRKKGFEFARRFFSLSLFWPVFSKTDESVIYDTRLLRCASGQLYIASKAQRDMAACVLASLHECPHKASGLHKKVIAE